VSSTTQRIAWPDAARGLAIILVVLHHSIQYTFEAGMAAPEWVALTEFFRTLRMPLFFAAAGLFAGKWVRAPWRDMLRAKVLLFAWVFVLWVLLRWVVFNAIPRDNIETGWRNILLHIVWPTGGWFIFALAIFFVVAKATARLDARIQLAVAAAVSIVWFGGVIEIRSLAWDGVCLFYVFFLFGCYWRQWLLTTVDKLRWPIGVGAVSLWCGVYLALDALGLVDALGLSFILRVLGLAAGIVLAVLLSRVTWLRSLGQETLPIYMVHSLIIYAVASAVLALGGPAWAGVQVWLPPAMAVLALAASLAVGRLAPRTGAGWLFATPQWLVRTYDRVTGDRDARAVARESHRTD
jgi:uncharacterized membrane protein YcfT